MNNGEKYTRYGNYYLAMMRIPDRARRAEFGLAIDEYMFDGVEPEWTPNSDEEFLWQMILPSMKTSIKQKFNGLHSKGKGKGPRPSMRGNQNARKDNYIQASDIVDAWNIASENRTIVDVSEKNWQYLVNAWPEIKSLETFSAIVKKASRDGLFEKCSDYFGYLFNSSCRYRNYM